LTATITRLKSCVNVMRFIYITALKHGDLEKTDFKKMRIIVRSETPPPHNHGSTLDFGL